MKLPKFLRSPEEDQPEALDTTEEETRITAAAFPEGEPEESALDVEAETISEGEALEEPVEAAEKPVEEEKPQVEVELAALTEEIGTAQESSSGIEGKPLEEIVVESEKLEETGLPISKPEAGELPLSEELPIPEPPKPSWPRRFIKWLFNKETKVGRVMRQLAIFAGVFALGLLFAYIVWVRPQVNKSSALAVERQQALSELTAAEDARLSVASELVDTRAALTTTQDEVKLLEARMHLAKASYHAAQARLAIVEKQGADALAAMDSAKAEIISLNEYLAAEDPDVSTELEARLTAAKSALVRDADLALSDLETLITLLMQQDKILMAK